nr:hypothetical protein [Kribbella turkmenica]
MVLALLVTLTIDPNVTPPGPRQGPELVHHVTLQLLGHVDVDHLRRAGVSVTEDVLNLLKRDILTPQQRRARMPQVVEPDSPYAGLGTERIEVAVHIARLDRRTNRGREHVPLIPGSHGVSPLTLLVRTGKVDQVTGTLNLLRRPMLLQDSEQ